MNVTCLDPRYNITYPLKQGMVVSNEPGYYEQGAFGIRIENLLTIKEVDTPHKFGGRSYFGFERLTFAPLQRKMLAFEVGVSRFCSGACNSDHQPFAHRVSRNGRIHLKASDQLRCVTAFEL